MLLRNILLSWALCLCATFTLAQSVGISETGTNPNPSAMLDVESTTSGMLIPRMSTTQRNLINLPAQGLLVFDLSTNSFWFYDGNAWIELKSGIADKLQDADQDTRIQLEALPDEDHIRMQVAGEERFLLDSTGSAIVGGEANEASGENAFVGGGRSNEATGDHSFVGGGVNNKASGVYSFAGGGNVNTAAGPYAFAAGGEWNQVNASTGFIGGGTYNQANAYAAFIAGGTRGLATGNYTFLGGGKGLTAPSLGETVLGLYNTPYTPVSNTVSDSTDRLFSIGNGTDDTARSNALTLLKNGKLGLGTDEPAERLEVNGAIRIADACSPTPEAGTIRWNDGTQDFEGYDGGVWKSLTEGGAEGKKWGDPVVKSIETGKFWRPNGAGWDYFGSSVSIDGDYALIGAQGKYNSGSAFIYHYDGTNWVEQAQLTPNDGIPEGFFGCSVALAGDYALIGAYGDDDDGLRSGAAYVFHFNGTNWVQQAKLKPSDGNQFYNFGVSVVIENNLILIGAWSSLQNGKRTGAAYIFQKNGSNWNQVTKLTASDGDEYDRFGRNVALSGNYALIGAVNNNAHGLESGAAYVFFYNGSNWSEQAKLTASDGAANDRFSWSIALSGDYALIGSKDKKSYGTNSGKVYVFHRNGNNWLEENTITGKAPGFALGIALSGDLALIGSGSSYIYRRIGINWIKEAELTTSDLISSSSFAISDKYVLIGASLDDITGYNSGSVYYFK